MSATDDRIAPGTVLEGKYRIERVIGHGGMGIVYEAEHLMLARKVAIKVLSPAMRERGDLAKRMIREARTVSAIGHPNIVAVMDLGLVDGSPFIVMELLAGVTLEAELAHRGPIAPPDAIGIASAVLDALESAHQRNVVHRDIKPGNVMLVREPTGRRVVKVLDFGIAKITTEGETTKTSNVLGTPVAMAPEQALGEDVDARADLYAVGALLYTLVVGEPPFAARESAVVIARMLEGKYTPASQRVASVSRELDAAIAKALARRREDRFANAAAMREALRACTNKVAPPRRASRTVEPPVAEAPPPPAAAPPVDNRFAPPPAARLDVATLIDRPPAAAVPVTRDVAPRSSLGPLVVVVLLLVAAFAGWRWYASSRSSAASADAEPVDDASSERVLIMISTTPSGATIWANGVLAERNPVELPKSDTPVEIRVEAKGYASKTIEVVPERSRRVEVALERK
jgi:serine/threonine protein kinase